MGVGPLEGEAGGRGGQAGSGCPHRQFEGVGGDKGAGACAPTVSAHFAIAPFYHARAFQFKTSMALRSTKAPPREAAGRRSSATLRNSL